MLSVRAFIDESDTREPKMKDIFSMGGWVADVETWERFSDDWQSVLKINPSIEYFKHNEAKSTSGQFEGWSKLAVNAKLCSLARVVDRHIDPIKHHYGVLTGIKPEGLRILFQKSTATARQVRSILKLASEYDFCFHAIIAMTTQRQALFSDPPVDFIFDTHSNLKKCTHFYEELKKGIPDWLARVAGTVTSGDDKVLMPLQAADLLVGQVTTNIKTGATEEPFKILARGGRILFDPLKWNETPLLSGYGSVLELFNETWIRMMAERPKK